MLGYQSLQMMKRPLFSPLYVDPVSDSDSAFIAARKKKAKMNRFSGRYEARNDRFIRRRKSLDSYPSLARWSKKMEDRSPKFELENEEFELEDEQKEMGRAEESLNSQYSLDSFEPRYSHEREASFEYGYQQPTSPLRSQMNQSMPTAQMISQPVAPGVAQPDMYSAAMQMQLVTAMQMQATAAMMQAQAAQMPRQPVHPYSFSYPSGYRGYVGPYSLPQQALSGAPPFATSEEPHEKNSRHLMGLLTQLSSDPSEVQRLVHLINREFEIIEHLAAGHTGYTIEQAVRGRNSAVHQSSPLVDETFKLIVNLAGSSAKKANIRLRYAGRRGKRTDNIVINKSKEKKQYLHSMIEALEHYYRMIREMQHALGAFSQ